MDPTPTLSLFFVFFLGSCSAALPSYIKACSRSDPNINQCMVQHGNEALPHLVKGDKSLKLPSLSPMRFDVINANVRNLKLTLKDVDIFGLDAVKLVDLDIDWEQQMWALNCAVERATLLGNYMVDGQILVLPVKGNGRFNITIDSLNINYKFFFKIEIKHGKEFAIMEDNDELDWTFTKVHFQFDNLFNGNKAMGDNVNKFLNENDADVMEELEEVVENVIKSVGHQAYNSVLGSVSLEEIFLA